MSRRKPALTLVKASSSSPNIDASTPSGWAARKLLLKSGSSYPDQVKYCSLSAASAGAPATKGDESKARLRSPRSGVVCRSNAHCSSPLCLVRLRSRRSAGHSDRQRDRAATPRRRRSSAAVAMTMETARITEPSAMTVGSDFGKAQLAPDEERQRRLGAGEKEGDDELVERGEEGQHEGRGDGRAWRAAASRGGTSSIRWHRDRSPLRAGCAAMAAKRLRMITTVVGSATSMWPSTIAMRDGPKPGEVDEDEQRNADDDAGNQDRQAGESAEWRRRARVASVELHVGDRDAASVAPERCAETDDQARLERAGTSCRLPRRRLVPGEREALERKRGLDRIIEREQRNERDRQIKEDDIGHDIGLEPACSVRERGPSCPAPEALSPCATATHDGEDHQHDDDREGRAERPVVGLAELGLDDRCRSWCSTARRPGPA